MCMRELDRLGWSLVCDRSVCCYVPCAWFAVVAFRYASPAKNEANSVSYIGLCVCIKPLYINISVRLYTCICLYVGMRVYIHKHVHTRVHKNVYVYIYI